MELAGHKCVGWCEIDKYCQKLYSNYFDVKDEYFCNDIRKANIKEFPEFDILCGGFPCQSFSVAGRGLGFEDARGSLFFEVARLAKEKRPSYLFLENVPGLLNHNKGNTFETVLRTLDEIGYDVEWDCINTRAYLPQKRLRVFIIGHLRGKCTRKIFPLGKNDEEINGKHCIELTKNLSRGFRVYSTEGLSVTLAGQAGGCGAKTGLYLIDRQNNKTKVRNDINCIDSNYYKGLGCHQARSGVLEVRACLTPTRLEKRQNGRRFKNVNEPMFTLTGQDIHGIMYNYKIRRLTPLECFRLQGFPDNIVELARELKISDRQLYKMAGNAVSVPVIYDIANKF